MSLPIIGEIGNELEETFGVSLRTEASMAYETSKTITYTTGAMEDTVVATVVPYDQYSYEILSHPVYPDLVGTDVVISLPRGPRYHPGREAVLQPFGGEQQRADRPGGL